MKAKLQVFATIALCLSLPAGNGSIIHGSSQAGTDPKKEASMKRATGTFDVKMVPQSSDDKAEGATLGRMSLDKQYRGDLDATAKGEMLTAMTSVKDSAGYVAVERVTGTLHGRRGTFALQHNGIMTRGVPSLSVTVVPDSGTGELVGIEGRLEIIIEGRKHSYVLEYTLRPTH